MIRMRLQTPISYFIFRTKTKILNPKNHCIRYNDNFLRKYQYLGHLGLPRLHQWYTTIHTVTKSQYSCQFLSAAYFSYLHSFLAHQHFLRMFSITQLKLCFANPNEIWIIWRIQNWLNRIALEKRFFVKLASNYVLNYFGTNALDSITRSLKILEFGYSQFSGVDALHVYMYLLFSIVY